MPLFVTRRFDPLVWMMRKEMRRTAPLFLCPTPFSPEGQPVSPKTGSRSELPHAHKGPGYQAYITECNHFSV